MTGAQIDLGHTIIELSGAGDSPGNGQHQVERVLHEQKKLLEARDTPDSPPFVRDQSGLRVKGEMTTAQIRTEYRRAPKLSISDTRRGVSRAKPSTIKMANGGCCGQE